MKEIENISDTARWVAVYRAMETARSDAIFKDPFAERLAGEKGVRIVEAMKNGRQMAWAMIVRTSIFDDVILDQVRNKGVDQVVNLAAGLDARAWRMPLPPTLKWVDVDLPGILDYKLEVLSKEKPVWRVRSGSPRPPRRGEATGVVLAAWRALEADACRCRRADHLSQQTTSRLPRSHGIFTGRRASNRGSSISRTRNFSSS